jgi:hypothetical protein
MGNHLDGGCVELLSRLIRMVDGDKFHTRSGTHPFINVIQTGILIFGLVCGHWLENVSSARVEIGELRQRVILRIVVFNREAECLAVSR